MVVVRRTNMGANLSGLGKWWGIATGLDGKLYCAPYSATDILVIDPATETAQRTNMGANLSGSNKWSGIVAGPDGKLYCAPFTATDILVIDPATGTAQRTNMGANLSGTYKWSGIATGPDGKLYCAPFNATDILVIDPATGTAQRTNMGIDLSGSNKWSGIVAGPDGKLYCAPFTATDILVIDPVAGTATRTDMGADLSGSNKWRGIALGLDGKLYCAPYNATDILIIDPATGTAERTDMGTDLSGGISKWWGIATGLDGKLYCAPYSDAYRPKDILIIDPMAGTAERMNLESGSSSYSAYWCGIVTGPDGNLYCAPHNASDILVIAPVLPAGLYFKDAMGYLSTANGDILRRVQFPRVYQGFASAPKRITVENRAAVAIQNVQIDVEEQPEEDIVELSLTDDPFVPEALPVTLPGPYDDGTETEPVYVRVVAGEKSITKEPRVVGLSVKAQPFVE